MPFFYLYDSFLQDRAYATALIKLETTLADLGIQGRIGRLTLLKSVRDIVEAAIRDGADTIVAVGNDTTMSQVSGVLLKHPKVTLGFIPLGNNQQTLAEILGIPVGTIACHVLSSRLTSMVNMGKIGTVHFLQSLTTTGSVAIECDRSFRLELKHPHQVRICNLDRWSEDGELTPPEAGKLEVVVREVLERRGFFGNKNSPGSLTHIPTKEIKLTSLGDELALIVDGYRTLKTPATITVVPKALKLIVGKKRAL